MSKRAFCDDSVIIISDNEGDSDDIIVPNSLPKPNCLTIIDQSDSTLYNGNTSSSVSLYSEDIFSLKSSEDSFHESLQIYNSVPQQEDLETTIYFSTENSKSSREHEKFSCEDTSTIKFSTEFSQSLASSLSNSSHSIESKVTPLPIDASNILLVENNIKAGGGKLTYLDQVKAPGRFRNLIVCVKLCMPIKEIWLKHRKTWLPMSILLLFDGKGNQIRLSLWADQCRYAFSISIGDILFINDFIVKTTFNEQVICLTKISVLTNLGQSNLFSSILNESRYTKELTHGLFEFTKLNQEEASIYSEIPSVLAQLQQPKQTVWDLSELTVGEGVNVKAFVIGVKHRKDSNKNNPCVIYISTDKSGTDKYTVFLNGSFSDWINNFRKYKTFLWEITNLTCCLSPQTDRMELHSTIMSSAECLFEYDKTNDHSNWNQASTYRCLQKLIRHKKNITLQLVEVIPQMFYQPYLRNHMYIGSSLKTKVNFITSILGRKVNESANSCRMKCYFNQDNPKTFFNITISPKTFKALFNVNATNFTQIQVQKKCIAAVTNLLKTKCNCLVMAQTEVDENDIALDFKLQLESIS